MPYNVLSITTPQQRLQRLPAGSLPGALAQNSPFKAYSGVHVYMWKGMISQSPWTMAGVRQHLESWLHGSLDQDIDAPGAACRKLSGVKSDSTPCHLCDSLHRGKDRPHLDLHSAVTCDPDRCV